MRNLLFLGFLATAFPSLLQAQEIDIADLQIHERYAVGVTQMVLAGDPKTASVFADKLADWRNDLPFAADQAPAIFQDWLLRIQDKRAVPDLRISPLPDADVAFHRAYCQALAYTFLITPEAFAASAKENPEVVFTHLYTRPEAYRGKVIHLEGRLARLLQREAPELAKRLGYSDKYVYEGYVFGKTKGTNPYIIIFPPSLPKGLKIAENMDVQVSFDGYFMSLIKYSAKQMDRYSPLLIGPPVVLKEKIAETPPETPISTVFVIGITGFVIGVAFLLVFLNLWFRRGDAKVRSHLAKLQGDRAMEALENSSNSTPLTAQPTPVLEALRDAIPSNGAAILEKPSMPALELPGENVPGKGAALPEKPSMPALELPGENVPGKGAALPEKLSMPALELPGGNVSPKESGLPKEQGPDQIKPGGPEQK